LINEERRKIQLEALEALEKNNYNGLFLLPTGTGKSWVLIEAVRRLREKFGKKLSILYLCNSTDLRDKDFPEEVLKWLPEIDFDWDIHYMCYQTAYKLVDQNFDIVIADEFDYCCTPEYIKFFLNNKATYRILTSAYIDSTKLEYLDTIGIDIIYKRSLQEIEDKSVVNKSEYYFVNFQMTDEESARYGELTEKLRSLMSEKGMLYATGDMRKLKYLSHKIDLVTRERKRFLNSLGSSARTCKKLLREIYTEDNKAKMLIFCELTKQADKICKYTYHNNSDPQNLEDFRNDKIQALAVCGKVNRGVNISNIQNIIFESCNQSKTQLIQRLGRGKRLKSDEVLKVYFLIPCYKENNSLKYTKVRDWIVNAAKNLDLSDSKLYKFKT
jgi:superfamily II DNA or RNA helicase